MARAPRRTPLRAKGLAVAATIAAATVGLSPPPAPAGAAVVHATGFQATIAGWTSWYGSYGMGDAGIGWCIDHGSRAPDAAFGYARTTVDDQPPTTRTAVAWLVSRHAAAATDDPVESAAVMLAGHDLMGAAYPTGQLDVDALDVSGIAGFGGDEGAVLERARALKVDALAHAELVPPYALSLEASPVPAAQAGTLTLRLSDAAGVPVPGMTFDVAGTQVATGADGTARTAFIAAIGANQFRAAGDVPDLELHALASTSMAAQRVAVPALVHLEAQTSFVASLPPGELLIHKSGDAGAYVSVAGAVFEVRDGAGAVVATTEADHAVSLPPGPYQVVETVPPPGYDVAGPWDVHVASGAQAVVEAYDEVRRSTVRVTKLDASTGAPLGGAVLRLTYDSDRDRRYDTAMAPITTTTERVEVGGLLPGDYELAEVEAPPGYVLSSAAIAFTLPPGETLVVAMRNQPAPVPVPTTNTTTTTSTLPPTSGPPPTVLGGPQLSRSLPRTGAPLTALALVGAGLVLLGLSACCRCGRASSDRAGATR